MNIQRHANATHVEVKLAAVDGGWELTVEDDGQGGIIFPNPSAKMKGLGVQGIAEAIAELHGSLIIEDTGIGTLLRARLSSASCG